MRRGFVNDSRLAAHVVEKNVGRGARGRLWVEATLASRGVSPDLIEMALGQFDEVAVARDVLRLNPGKSIRFLAGRGFTEETIEKILEIHL